MIGLLVLAGVVVVALIAYGLHKKGKAVTAGNVISTAESDVKADASKVETEVKSDNTKAK